MSAVPRVANKTEVMSVAVDTRRFKAAPFDLQDGVFRICFAGRLDEFKDPPLMFDVLPRLHAKLNGKLEFRYVGATDPARYPESVKAASFTTCHGAQTSDGVRTIMARCHAGVLTSYFEGLPCFLLDMLASGRPIGAIELPQYAPLILPGISGVVVARRELVTIAPRHSPTRLRRYGATSRAAASVPCACTDWSSHILWRHGSAGFSQFIGRCRMASQCRRAAQISER